MLSLLKKKTEAAAPVSLIPSWHPNFRRFEALPDIKPVRTAFFVNGAAAFVALVLLFILGRSEYELHSVNAQIVDWQRQIDRDRPGNDQALALYKSFQNEQKRLTEVDAFIKSKPVMSLLLQRFAETRPKSIAFEGIDIRAPEPTTTVPTPPSINLRGTVRGAPDLATGEASAYLDVLKADPVLSPLIDDVNFTSVTRSTATGRLKIEILIKFKLPKKP